MINASPFKSNINKLTEFRIEQIVKYVIYCYLKMLSDKKTYSYSERGKIPKEDYLSDKLVNDYLRNPKNKQYYKNHISDNPSVEIVFNPGENMIYFDKKNNERRKDEIDIAIWESNLNAIWSDIVENEIKFAIECKRIESISDTTNYVGDIGKFCDRPFYCYNNRLSFEGQIAFIENQNITHTLLQGEVNKRLQNHNSIITNSLLNPISLNDKFNGSYLSKHQRNTSKQNFSIYHLFFNYSNIVID